MAGMEGKYILRRDHGDHYEILREKKDSNLVYETVIPDAGYNREFAMGLLTLLNSQDSQTGNTADSGES